MKWNSTEALQLLSHILKGECSQLSTFCAWVKVQRKSEQIVLELILEQQEQLTTRSKF